MSPGRIKDGGDDEVCCLFWLFLRQSGATVVLPAVGGIITPPITMVAITIIGVRDGGTVIAGGGGARRINDLRLCHEERGNEWGIGLTSCYDIGICSHVALSPLMTHSGHSLNSQSTVPLPRRPPNWAAS